MSGSFHRYDFWVCVFVGGCLRASIRVAARERAWSWAWVCVCVDVWVGVEGEAVRMWERAMRAEVPWRWVRRRWRAWVYVSLVEG